MFYFWKEITAEYFSKHQNHKKNPCQNYLKKKFQYFHVLYHTYIVIVFNHILTTENTLPFSFLTSSYSPKSNLDQINIYTTEVQEKDLVYTSIIWEKTGQAV